MIKNIRIINKDPYRDMKRRALKTMGKTIRKDDVWDEEWIKKSIVSRHSHIRCVFIEIEFETSRAVRNQILRSKHGYVEPYVTSNRPDRNGGTPRDPDALSSYTMDFNLEGLIKMAGDRLCTSTEKETRNQVRHLKQAMLCHSDRFINVVGQMLAPKCAWFGDCNEFYPLNCFNFCEPRTLKIKDRIDEYTKIGYAKYI